MIKVLVFIRKLPQISMEAFIDYYDNRHAPMIDKMLPFYAGYRRNYMMQGLYPDGVTADFDVVTELMFASQNDYDAWLTALQNPDVIAQIRADEANFLDSTATRMWAVRAEGYG